MIAVDIGNGGNKGIQDIKQQFSKTSTAAGNNDFSIQNALKKSVLKPHNNPSPVPPSHNAMLNYSNTLMKPANAGNTGSNSHSNERSGANSGTR